MISKYLAEEFGFENLGLLKQKGTYPYEYMKNSKRFSEEKFPDRKCFYRSTDDGTTGDNGEKLDSHVSYEDYLTCEKSWDVFGTNYMGDYYNHPYEKRCSVIS